MYATSVPHMVHEAKILSAVHRRKYFVLRVFHVGRGAQKAGGIVPRVAVGISGSRLFPKLSGKEMVEFTFICLWK